MYQGGVVARIPDEVIERLKKEVDLAALVQARGVELSRAGGDLVGRCPFHDDDTPSLVLTPAKGLWHCLGACQVGGSVIDWVMRAEGVSFRHAAELLLEGSHEGRGSYPRPVPKISTVHRLAAPVEADAEDAEVLGQVVDYYHATLASSPEALDYLARRRIDDPDAVERFRLGYANRTLGLRLPARRRIAGDKLRDRLRALGVLRASGHEHLAGSLVVPITAKDGTVTGLYGRKIRDDLRAGTALHLYLPGPHKGIFNAGALTTGSEVVLTESLIDALSFYCAGFVNVTSSYGTNGFTGELEEALVLAGVARVLIAYDNDPAGNAAAASLAARLGAHRIECFRVVCPAGADVNEVAMSADVPRKALAKLVREAVWTGRGRAPGRGEPGGAPGEPSSSAGTAAGARPSPAPAPSPVPPGPSAPVVLARHDELVVVLGGGVPGDESGRRWRVRNIPEAPAQGALRVNVMVSCGERFHVDTLDLYSARGRAAYCESASTELRAGRDVLKSELGRVLLAVEEAQAGALRERSQEPAPAQMTSAEREAALELCCDPDLIERVAEAFSSLGVVGEREAAVMAFLVATSRLAERPLGAVIQSSSAAGKSTLANTALALVPDEHKVAWSAMTGQALYYLGERDLSHKVLAIAEEEGASRASYALKLLVSEGSLSIAAAGKDPQSGRLVTSTYEVTGPVALIMTTTAALLEPELANRLVVLAVDEGRAQTRAVQSAQRDAETLDGLVRRAARQELIALWHNAQRLLSPLAVVNPHAPSLSFTDTSTRHRRDNAKFLATIRAVALAHQHQRERKVVALGGRCVTYIEASVGDVALAEELLRGVLSATTDELSPATRRLLGAISAFTRSRGSARFTRRELREATGLGDSQLKVHLSRLVDLEHVAARGAGPSTSYELVGGEAADAAEADADKDTCDGDPPGAVGDRPASSAYRPGSGRVANTEVGAIGRISAGSAEKTSAHEDTDNPPYRPGAGKLHVLGEKDPGVVVASAGTK
jgi:DNA primase